jgi:acyl carrier protein phosphodiesterase
MSAFPLHENCHEDGVFYECVNYLAHAYLSFGSDPVLLGNLISDFVKGKAVESYPEAIQRGIRLHRRIDHFTDTHPEVKRAAQYLAPAAGRYSGVFLDIVYDHFLATDEKRFTPQTLKSFSGQVYETIRDNEALLPDVFLYMFRFMEQQDWLYHYSTREGIRRSLSGMARRAQYLRDDAPVFEGFEAHYEELRRSYSVFFPELEAYAREQFAL